MQNALVIEYLPHTITKPNQFQQWPNGQMGNRANDCIIYMGLPTARSNLIEVFRQTQTGQSRIERKGDNFTQ